MIVTETNIARKSFENHIGSDAAQRNYFLKATVKSQQLGVKQVYWFATGEAASYDTAASEYDLMGFYENLKRDAPGQQKLTQEGIAHRTAAQMLFGWSYDAAATAALKLPAAVDGGAFLQGAALRYVLWARTTRDQDENASATISLPGTYTAVAWDGARTTVSGNNLQLSGAPLFLTPQ